MRDDRIQEKEFIRSLLSVHGPHVLYQQTADKLERAIGDSLPQMEIRFENVSIQAKIAVPKSKKKKSSQFSTFGNSMTSIVTSTFGSKKVYEKDILHDISGVLTPGTMTLVLGQPASGKSTLMKYLSGRLHYKKNVNIRGQVLYNGVPNHQLSSILPQFVSYVSQKDANFPLLTVKETFEFAQQLCAHNFPSFLTKKCKQIPDDQSQQEIFKIIKAMYHSYPEIILQSFGLGTCQDTIVGDEMLRGISGGERKRMTNGEMEIGLRNVVFLDEITTGLDSAAALDIVKLQRTLARYFHRTVVVALLQPSPEIFELFDELILLNNGHVMYQGPRDKALQYFAKMGFHCPSDKDPADFLLDLGTKEQIQFHSSSVTNAIPRSPEEFALKFHRSRHYARIQQKLLEPMDSIYYANVQDYLEPTLPFNTSFLHEVSVLTRRNWLLTIRNRALVRGRSLLIVISGFLYGTVYYQINPEDTAVMIGMFFAASAFIALGQVAMISDFMQARDIFYKHRDANFHRTSSFVLATTLVQMIPIAFRGIVFGSMVYWLCGLVPFAMSYLNFVLVLSALGLTFNAWFFFIAMISPDIHVAHPCAMVSILFCGLYAGFVVLRPQIPVYLIWLYWNNPIAWSIRALAVNQYRSQDMDVCEYKDINYCKEYGTTFGRYALALFDVQQENIWILYGFFYLLGTYLLLTLCSVFALKYKRIDPVQYDSSISNEGYEDGKLDDRKESYTTLQTPIEPNVAIPMYNHHNPQCVPVTIAFKDLSYSVPNPNDGNGELYLLQNVSGYAKPGSMTALMGSSGAGKTTLLDVIAGRKTGGTVRGEILLNGHAATDLAVRRATGYCEQMDIHSDASTFREAITFSAFLRQGSDVSDDAKYRSVEECLDLLNLNAIADRLIRGSSVEQLKRLTIGVELAAQPSVLFLDEPTSGLDARSAKAIMDGVRKVADSGRTILCTIHQPSYEIFQLFDNLLVLKRGGQTVYFGELGAQCQHLIGYLQEIPGVQPKPPRANPANYMLEVIGAGVSNASNIDFVKHFDSSVQCQELISHLTQDGIGFSSSTIPPLCYSNKRAAGSLTQMRFVIYRFFTTYWRTPTYTLTRFLIAFLLAFVFGITFLNGKYQTYQEINSGMGMLFVSSLFLSFIVTDGTMAPTFQERGAFYRERASQTYNAFWYFAGSSVAEIPYILLTSTVFSAVFYPMVGFNFEWGSWFLFTFAVFTQLLLCVFMGKCIASVLPSLELAMVVNIVWSIASLLTMGFTPPASVLPNAYRWLYHILPRRYQFYSLASIAFGQCQDASDLGCVRIIGAPSTIGNVTVQQFIKAVFEVDYDDVGKNFSVCFGTIVLFLLITMFSVRYINYQKR